MTPLVQWTELPRGENPGSLVPAPDPMMHVVHGLAAPDMTRRYHLEHELFTALGKRTDVAGGLGRDDGAPVIAAWLQAYRTRWVLLFSAQDIPAQLAEAAAEPVAAGGARLLLVADPGYGQQTAQAFAGWAPARIGYREWADANHVALQPIARAQEAHSDRDRSPWLDIDIPRTDWPWFRAACRDTLTAPEFALVDELYLRSLRAVRKNVTVPEARRADSPGHDRVREAVLDALVPLVSEVQSRAQGTVALRAAQAALIPAGLLPRAELEPFLQSLADSHRPPTLSPERWRSMRAYRDPWRPLFGTLLLSGLSYDSIYALAVGDVLAAKARDDGTLAGVEVHPDGWEYVVAQYYVRRAEGANNRDPLLDMGTSALGFARRALRNDLSIALGAEERSHLGETLHDTWLRVMRRRLTVTDIR